MATGSAILFNIRLPQNFDSPFKASSLINFWHRWHITLFKFLMNYIYFPWIRSLKKITYSKAMFVTFCVFIISGIWHGPTWGYVMFGILHGVGLIINHTFIRLNLFKIPSFVGWFLTMFWVNLTQIFFRSKDLDTAIYISKSIFGLNGFEFKTNLLNDYLILSASITALIIVFCFKNTNYLIENHFKNNNSKI
jgi:D-alanyl-lipoteichoic acid acyltransferase DltB (MBOAT superfamily)